MPRTSSTAPAPFQQQVQEYRRAEEARHRADGQYHGRYNNPAGEVREHEQQRPAAAEQGTSQR